MAESKSSSPIGGVIDLSKITASVSAKKDTIPTKQLLGGRRFTDKEIESFCKWVPLAGKKTYIDKKTYVGGRLPRNETPYGIERDCGWQGGREEIIASYASANSPWAKKMRANWQSYQNDVNERMKKGELPQEEIEILRRNGFPFVIAVGQEEKTTKNDVLKVEEENKMPPKTATPQKASKAAARSKPQPEPEELTEEESEEEESESEEEESEESEEESESEEEESEEEKVIEKPNPKPKAKTAPKAPKAPKEPKEKEDRKAPERSERKPSKKALLADKAKMKELKLIELEKQLQLKRIEEKAAKQLRKQMKEKAAERKRTTLAFALRNLGADAIKL